MSHRQVVSPHKLTAGTKSVRAILFDLHDTLTKTRESPTSLFRRICTEFEIDLGRFADADLRAAFDEGDRWLAASLLEQNVDPEWGGRPEDFLGYDRIVFNHLGLTGLSDELVVAIEARWKQETCVGGFEFFPRESIDTVEELFRRGYRLGICTRRFDNPESLLQRAGVRGAFSSVRWSGVHGFCKPSPYTLILAARDLGINPALCAFVGDSASQDIEAARRAGMVPVLVNPKESHEGRSVSEAVLVIKSVKGILKLFPGPSAVEHERM